MAVLTKKNESLIKALYTRKGRKKNSMCVCEGLRCCYEVFLLKPESVQLAVCSEEFDLTTLPESARNYNFIRVAPDKMKQFSATVATQGVLVVASKPSTLDVPTPVDDPFIFVLDRVADPGNFGTIMRTAKSVGLKELWFTAGSVDPFNDKVIRSAMGAQFGMTLREFADLDVIALELQKHGYNKVYRTTPHEGESCFTAPALFDKTAIVIGNEANGAAELDGSYSLTIPMPGNYESINAAQAATVILFEYVRRISCGN